MENTTIRTTKTQRKALVLQTIAKKKAYRRNYKHFKATLKRYANKITDYSFKDYKCKNGTTLTYPYIKTQDGNYMIGSVGWWRE